MRTLYIYLSVTGWVWMVVVMTYLSIKLRPKSMRSNRHGFPVIPVTHQANQGVEAKQSNEQ